MNAIGNLYPSKYLEKSPVRTAEGVRRPMSTQAVITEFCERHPGAPAYKLGLCLPCFRGDATNVRETMGSFRYKKRSSSEVRRNEFAH
jgi:hypothetical protein